MSKFSGFLAAGVLALSGVTAMAADLPQRAPAPAPLLVNAFTWSGFYVGLHAGYDRSRGDRVGIHTPNPGSVFDGVIGKADPKGFVGGGQIGYNLQYGSIVYGIEGDASFMRARASAVGIRPITGADRVRERRDWFGSIRGRLGFAADRALFYVTGGLGYTDVKSGIRTSLPALSFGGNSSVRFGWVGGAGVEYAFTNNWTARLEGFYYHVPNFTLATANGNFTKVTQSHYLGRVGVNYKF